MTSSPNQGRYVRAASETERVLLEHPDRTALVIAMRRGIGIDRLTALAMEELCRRGYTTSWRLLHDEATHLIALQGLPQDAAMLVDPLATRVVEGGLVWPEPDRDARAAEWDEIASTVGEDFDPADEPGARRARVRRWWGMYNRAMRDKLERGECVDLATCARTAEGYYVVPPAVWQEGVDYCDADGEHWIWSVGRHVASGVIHASTQSDLYQNPAYECLFLR